ncbi:MAG: hypothetical protein V4574_16135 [Pseudomonadota bacterium]
MHYRALFDVAPIRFYPGEAEIEIALDGEGLAVSLEAWDGEADAAAMEAARSVLSQLAELDAQASGYLFAIPGWPYGEDARLWLLLVQSDNVRFCYAQNEVNDEQVIGFSRQGADGWRLQGPDPRRRGKGDSPWHG